MRTLPLFAFPLVAGAAQAHPGHLVDAAGHDHWMAGAAIGAAIAVGIWGALKGRSKGADKVEPTEDRQEA